jgi:hypothetical protein
MVYPPVMAYPPVTAYLPRDGVPAPQICYQSCRWWLGWPLASGRGLASTPGNRGALAGCIPLSRGVLARFNGSAQLTASIRSALARSQPPCQSPCQSPSR